MLSRPCNLITSKLPRAFSQASFLARPDLTGVFRPYRAGVGLIRSPKPAASVHTAANSYADMSDWPCGQSALEAARKFVRDAASKEGKIVLAPDRDADGLCAGEKPLQSQCGL